MEKYIKALLSNTKYFMKNIDFWLPFYLTFSEILIQGKWGTGPKSALLARFAGLILSEQIPIEELL